MDTFLFALNAVLPIILLILLGYILRQKNLYDDSFLQYGNTFVFRAALPALLFYNVYSVESLRAINWSVVLFACVMTFFLFCCGLITVHFCTKDPKKKGVILQCVFRSNFAIIGIPLAKSLGGESAVAIASILSAFTIPIFNVLAVISLTIFEIDSNGNKISVSEVFRKIRTNPLILGVLLGFCCLVIRSFVPFDADTNTYIFTLKDNLPFLYSAIKDVGTIASPLALIVLGGKFHVSVVKPLAKYIAVGTVWRVILAPVLALSAAVFLSYAEIFNFTSTEYPAFVALFGTPVAVSSAIMAGEMGADEELAGQLVVWTSICSVFTIFLCVVVLRSIGML